MDTGIKKKKGFKLPHVYIIIMIIMLLVTILSWVIPSGEFATIEDPETGREIINPDEFKYIENDNPITFMDFFTSIHNGIVESGDIVISLLLISGTLYLVEQSGAIGAGIHRILEISKGKELMVIAILTLVFTILGAIGFGEGGLPFIPLSASVVMALGYDRIAGVATAMMGMAIGFASGVLNIFTTGIAQSIVGLPIFSGLGFRMIGLIIFYLITVIYIVNYCKKIKEDPTKSVVAEEYTQSLSQETKEEKIEFTTQRKLALLGLVFIFVFQAVGALKLGWGMPQIAAIYLIFAVILTIIFKWNPSKTCLNFASGAQRMLPAALTIGLARSVMILLTQGKIVDTAIYGLAHALKGKGSIAALLLIYISIITFNFFVVSGSGKAVIMMPILGPLGQLTKINQQVMVLLYQYGDGFTNYFWPSSGGLMAGLTMCDVEWGDWVKFSWKLISILSIVGFILVIIANSINLGPF